MRILFICGSLEPGRDGVGDYTRRLATELIRQHHTVYLIAINDRHIRNTLEKEETSECVELSVLRLASIVGYNRRFDQVKERISQFDPEWISLQYVPFSFQKKGLTWWFGKQLGKVGIGRKWHVMFHELWVGMNAEAPVKHKVLGRLQELFIKNIIKNLAPECMHTQSSLYRNKLERLGYKVDLLPLFSNIPITGKAGGKTADILSLIVFGAIQPKAPIAQFVKDLADYRIEKKKEVQLTFIGRNGNELENWVSNCTEKGIGVEVLGEKPLTEISETLRKADWGISSTPYYQSEKSGTIAAMRDHDLPVYCVARPWTVKKTEVFGYPEGIKKYEPKQLDFSYPSFSGKTNSLERITQLFSDNLNNIEK